MRIRCPICRSYTTWEENPWRPFCSERCKLIDLGKWAMGEYWIEGEKVEEENGDIQKDR
ncbi:MAG: DNA gyrase inhibitor YacG [Nitrospirae bacterium]|nr:MAG: DNA gyrase inhibitor YacG [Nitrospirota bacterium]